MRLNELAAKAFGLSPEALNIKPDLLSFAIIVVFANESGLTGIRAVQSKEDNIIGIQVEGPEGNIIKFTIAVKKWGVDSDINVVVDRIRT